MASPTILPAIDVNAAKEQARSSYRSVNAPSGFDRFISGMSYGAGVMNPVVSESVYAATGNMQTTSVVSAALNAAAGPGGSPMFAAGGMGMAGSQNYLTGGSPMYSTGLDYGGGGDGGMQGGVGQMISQSYANQEFLLVAQTELNNIQSQTTAYSNALAAKHSAMRSVINNFRVA